MMTNPWILTAHSRKVDLLDPRPETIALDDIIWHLAHINRFNGAASRPLSVLEHSLNTAKLVDLMGGRPAAQLRALMHDAHEAYLGDISSPMKAAIARVAGRTGSQSLVIESMQRGMDAAIQVALGLPKLTQQDRNLIHLGDRWALAFERKALMPDNPEWQVDLSDAPASIVVPRYTDRTLQDLMWIFEAKFNFLKQLCACSAE